MNIKSVLGIILVIIGAALFVNVIIEPLYPAGVDVISIWMVVDLLVVLGLIVAAVNNYRRKRAFDAASDGSITREYVEVNLLFWGLIPTAIWFLPTWFQFLTGVEEIGRMVWIVADSLVLLILLPTGLHLIRSGRDD